MNHNVKKKQCKQTFLLKSTMSSKQMTLEQLLEAHKEEQKQLTSKIIGLRKGVPKSNKQKKREVNSRIADLEYDLKKKQDEEIRVLKAVEAGIDPSEEQVSCIFFLKLVLTTL